jgi:His/Glu/Gln/Arg/opine family amino acid ABC transporter permease subunit
LTGISFDPAFFLTEIGVAFSYLPVVAVLSIIPLFLGLIFGTGLALVNIYRVKYAQSLARGYVVVMRSIPVLLQMFIVYYGMQVFYSSLGWDKTRINKFLIILIVFTLEAAGFLSEGIRAALTSVDSSQYEASHSVGMTRFHTMRYVVIPQCFQVAIPVIGSSFIGIIKGSSTAYIMGIIEMIQGTSMKTAGNYKYLEAYCAVAVIYWGLTILIEQITRFAEGKAAQYMKGGFEKK